MLEINVYYDFLKGMRSVARFDWSGRLFQSLAHLYEKIFWPFAEADPEGAKEGGSSTGQNLNP